MSYTNVLIPLDGSADAVFACEIAVNLSSSNPAGRTFHLLHCVEPVPGLIGGESRETIHDDQRNEADQIFAQAKEILEAAGFPCRTYLREGSPATEIPDAAKELRCDIIVMGTRGVARLQSLVLGSVSQSVLRHAEVPVILTNRVHHHE